MSKYIIELEDDIKYLIINGRADNRCYTLVRPVAELEVLNSDYINENFGNLQEEAYKRGINDGSLDVKQRVEGAYQRGLEDAWEAARKISLMSPDEIEKVFPGAAKYNRYNLGYSGVEVIAKLKAYEDKQKDRIEVGDIVEVYGNLGVVTYMYELEACVMMIEDGSSGNWNLNELKKTGKHYDIASILEAMRTHDQGSSTQ